MEQDKSNEYLKPICSEHSFACELWLDGKWVPGAVYRKLTDQWWGVLRVEALGDGEERIWENGEATDFEEDCLELVSGSGGDSPQYGPALRMPITVRVRTAKGVVFRHGGYELGLKEAGPVPCSYAKLTLDEEGEVLQGLDLSRIIDQFAGAECCGTCQFGAHGLYGGGDTMFGLHCFRDAREVMADRGLYIEAADNMSRVAYPHTPLLHWCPSYQRWESGYQKWTMENPPNPGTDLQIDASRLYNSAVERSESGEYAEALMLFRQSEALSPHPVTALRVAQQLFALGRFSEIDYPESHLWTDGWIRIGILASAFLGDQAAVQGWLGCSEKVRNSKFVRAFLEVVEPACGPLSQRARLIAPLVEAKDYGALLRF